MRTQEKGRKRNTIFFYAGQKNCFAAERVERLLYLIPIIRSNIKAGLKGQFFYWRLFGMKNPKKLQKRSKTFDDKQKNGFTAGRAEGPLYPILSSAPKERPAGLAGLFCLLGNRVQKKPQKRTRGEIHTEYYGFTAQAPLGSTLPLRYIRCG